MAKRDSSSSGPLPLNVTHSPERAPGFGLGEEEGPVLDSMATALEAGNAEILQALTGGLGALGGLVATQIGSQMTGVQDSALGMARIRPCCA